MNQAAITITAPPGAHQANTETKTFKYFLTIFPQHTGQRRHHGAARHRKCEDTMRSHSSVNREENVASQCHASQSSSILTLLTLEELVIFANRQ